VELIETLDEELAKKDRDEWGRLFDENGVVWGPAHSPMEVITDPCVLENDYIVEYEHFSHGKVKGIRCPIQLSENPTRTPSGAAEYGQHTEEVLQELGYDWDDISKLKDQKVIP